LYDARLWREYAKVYDEVLNVLPYRNLLLELVDLAGITPRMRVLDGCCGTGNLFWALGEQGIKADIVGVDLTEEMLAKAKLKADEYKGHSELVRANLDEPVDTWGLGGKFDRFIFNNCLAFLGDPGDVVHKLATIAAPEAVLVISTPRPNPNITELLEEHLQLSEGQGISREEALQRMMPQLQPIIKCNEELMARYGDSYHLPSEPQLRGWFEGSGWGDLQISTAYAGQNWLVTATKD
jgi:2-polyprenyl-3-methyl-5-hydroxy-6-metoxy-1,4-benzoquinol methylase